MDYNSLKELIGIVNNSGLTEFECRQNDFYVRMSKNSSPLPLAEMKNQKESVDFIKTEKTTVISDEISEPITIMPPEKSEVKKGNVVKAPVVGTFYQSGSPEKPPFVKVGDKVKEGDLLCIIEAMKIMNEIKSPYSGEIDEILVSNEDMVEYDQPLFRIV